MLMSKAGADERGAIFTRAEVASFMLDLAGYKVDRPLWTESILEPSFGGGDFLLPIVERLISSYLAGVPENRRRFLDLVDCIRGVELHGGSHDATAATVTALLIARGVPEGDALALCSQWLVQDDFLLTHFELQFDHVVGNPPYLRQESVAETLLAEYRRRYTTIYDRADLYVPFIERGLLLLKPGGALTFICSDRWMKNRYGGPIRDLIASRFHVESYIDMVGTDAFQREVSAYPGIITISNSPGTETRVSGPPEIRTDYLQGLAVALKNGSLGKENPLVEVIPNAIRPGEPWLLDCAAQLHVIRDIEASAVPLELAGCRIGIGVATGRDRIFIQPFDELDVEPDRKLPLVMADDLRSGQLSWGGKGVINPFDPAGGLVSLDEYPRLAAFLALHETEIRSRNVARRNPERWYRTIDRINPSLLKQPKLLVPDIRSEPNFVIDHGQFYPHHNLYWITSSEWQLAALQTVLRSSVARLFVWAYSVKMRGGYLRYQAQNLRRIHVPRWETLSAATRTRLAALSQSREQAEIDEAVFDMYGLKSRARNLVSELFDRMK
jgi:hypothetical protein